MTELHPLGPELEPPHGGLARLQHAVEGTRKAPRPGSGYWIAAGLAAGLVLLSILVPWHTPPGQQRIREAVKETLTVSTKTRFKNAAYTEIPSRDPHVRILLVGSLDASRQDKKDRTREQAIGG